MPVPSEDKAIMVERARLELWWNTALSPTAQTDWMTRWLTNPPTDAYARTYTPYVRTNLQTTTRPPATIYAWSQIFSTYRLGYPPLTTPQPGSADFVLATWSTLTTTNLAATLTRNTPAATGFDAFIYASGCLPPGQTPKPKRCSFMNVFWGIPDGAVCDFTEEWLQRNTPVAGAPVLVMAFMRGPSNELGPQSTPDQGAM